MLPLMIIDMQTGFLKWSENPAMPRVIDNCAAQARAAVKRGDPIILVEYNECGPTVPVILDAMAGGQITVLSKTTNSLLSGYNLSDTVAVSNILDSILELTGGCLICGINANQCVQATVEDLAVAYPDVHFQLIEGACDNTFEADADFYYVDGFENLHLLTIHSPILWRKASA